MAQVRRRWPRVRVLLRADSGFAREELATTGPPLMRTIDAAQAVAAGQLGLGRRDPILVARRGPRPEGPR